MHKQRPGIHAIGVAVSLLFAAAPAAAQLRAEVVAAGFDRPLAIVPDPSTPKTLIVLEQKGLVHAVVSGVTQPTPFLDLTSEVKIQNEQGLLGLAFSPDGNRVFVCFIKKRTPDGEVGDLVVARFRRSGNPLELDKSSRFELVWPDGQPFIYQPFAVHKGGNLVFGPDGYLYLGLGDAGGSNHPLYNAQLPTLLTGKMLRLDVNVPEAHPRGYVVPPNNPFVDGLPIAALHEIWAFGFRNPWRFSFDDYGPGATGALIVGDVGEGTREEIDYEPAGRGGRNYGWFLREGSVATPGVPPTAVPAYTPLTGPLVDYPRSSGGSAVTGGYVYRGSALPAMFRGRYFVADFFGGVYSLGLSIDGAGQAHVANVLDHTSELGAPYLVPTFGRDLDGELYFSSFVGGRIYKIVVDPAALPTPPTGLSAGVAGSTVSLSWQPGQGGAPVTSYQLEVGSQSGAVDLLITETLAPGIAASGVPDGLYFVRVRSVNAVGVSGPSNEIAVRVGCTGPPASPSGLGFQVGSGRLVSLTWGAVTEATGYRVEAGSAPGSVNLAVIPTVATSIGGVVPPATYYVRVRATNACGFSPPSGEVVIHVP